MSFLRASVEMPSPTLTDSNTLRVMAQMIEDEVYALTLSGPAGGGSVRSERRPSLAVIDGYIDCGVVGDHHDQYERRLTRFLSRRCSIVDRCRTATISRLW